MISEQGAISRCLLRLDGEGSERSSQMRAREDRRDGGHAGGEANTEARGAHVLQSGQQQRRFP